MAKFPLTYKLFVSQNHRVPKFSQEYTKLWRTRRENGVRAEVLKILSLKDDSNWSGFHFFLPVCPLLSTYLDPFRMERGRLMSLLQGY